MAEGPKEGDEGFSFVDKVRLMMYGEQEKEAFLIEKKEKEEKKKAEKLEKEAAGEEVKIKKQNPMDVKKIYGQVKSFFVPSKQHSKASEEEKNISLHSDKVTTPEEASSTTQSTSEQSPDTSIR